jgi:hypothetical protein
MGKGKRKKHPERSSHGAGSPSSLCTAAYLPLVKEPEECLKLELRHAGEVDRVCVGCALRSSRGAVLGTAWKGEHGTEDERVLGQEVPVNTEETILDLHTIGCESEHR